MMRRTCTLDSAQYAHIQLTSSSHLLSTAADQVVAYEFREGSAPVRCEELCYRLISSIRGVLCSRAVDAA